MSSSYPLPKPPTAALLCSHTRPTPARPNSPLLSAGSSLESLSNPRNIPQVPSSTQRAQKRGNARYRRKTRTMGCHCALKMGWPCFAFTQRQGGGSLASGATLLRENTQRVCKIESFVSPMPFPQQVALCLGCC